MKEVGNVELLLKEVRNISNTPGHSKKLRKGKCLRHIYIFPERYTEVWNKLSEDVVLGESA